MSVVEIKEETNDLNIIVPIKTKRRRGRPRKIKKPKDKLDGLNNIDENVEVPEEKVKGKRKRKSRKKKDELVEVEEQSDDMKKIEKMKNELRELAYHNPDILTRDIINDEQDRLINDMDEDELQQRIIVAKRELSSKIDKNITKGAVSVVNKVVGGLLGCVEELEDSMKDDEIIQETANDYIGQNVLYKIPLTVKLLGVYSLHVSNAIRKRKIKREAILKARALQNTNQPNKPIKKK